MNTAPLKELHEENSKSSWSLASDEKLLEYLKLFSSDITKSTKDCSDHINNLNYSLSETETCLRNTFNEFIMLGNSQFIENVRFSLLILNIDIILFLLIIFF